MLCILFRPRHRRFLSLSQERGTCFSVVFSLKKKYSIRIHPQLDHTTVEYYFYQYTCQKSTGIVVLGLPLAGTRCNNNTPPPYCTSGGIFLTRIPTAMERLSTISNLHNVYHAQDSILSHIYIAAVAATQLLTYSDRTSENPCIAA